MASKITFAKDFAWPIIITTFGALSIGWSAVNDAYNLYTAGPPDWAFTFAGLALFLVGFVVALYTAVTKAASHAVREIEGKPHPATLVPTEYDGQAAREEIQRLTELAGKITARWDDINAALKVSTDAVSALRTDVAALHTKTSGLSEAMAPMTEAYQALSILPAAYRAQKICPQVPDDPKDLLKPAPRVMGGTGLARRESEFWHRAHALPGLDLSPDQMLIEKIERDPIYINFMDDTEEARFGTRENKRNWHLKKAKFDKWRSALDAYVKDLEDKARPYLETLDAEK